MSLSDPYVEAALKRRVGRLDQECARALDAIHFLRRLASKAGERLYRQSPAFYEWVRRARVEEACVILAKVFERRLRSKDLRNLPELLEFLKRHQHVLAEAGDIRDLQLAGERLASRHARLIHKLIHIRDKAIVHLTAFEGDVFPALDTLETLARETDAFLGRLRAQYSIPASATPASTSDLFIKPSGRLE